MYEITIDLECTSDTMADVITLLELQLPYMADNVMVRSTLVEDDPDLEPPSWMLLDIAPITDAMKAAVEDDMKDGPHAH